MMLLGFTFSSFMFAMNREPRFKGIGIETTGTNWVPCSFRETARYL